MAALRYNGIGQCIYCSNTDGKLGEEHIIARAFGGLLIMKDASCGECERITSRIETKCAEAFFGPAQSYFGIKARKSRAVPTRIQTYLGSAHSPRKIGVLADQHPNVMILFGFVGPGLFSGRDPAQKIGVQFLHVPLSEGWRERVGALGGSIVYENLGPATFGRLLAKIGHAYAMAVRPGEFDPCLVPIIRGESSLPISHYIGRRVEPVGTSSTLHDIGIHRETLENGRSYWFVRLRLFANIPDTPVHDIIVGEAIDELHNDARPLE